MPPVILQPINKLYSRKSQENRNPLFSDLVLFTALYIVYWWPGSWQSQSQVISSSYFDVAAIHTKCMSQTSCQIQYISRIIHIAYAHFLFFIMPPASTKLKGGYTGLTLSVWQLRSNSPKMSVCEQNRVHSVSTTILIGSISYLHILSSNFRGCVACNVCFKIWNFGKFFKFVTLTLSSFDLGSNMTQ